MKIPFKKSKHGDVFLLAALFGLSIPGWASPQSDKSAPARPQATSRTAAPGVKLAPLEIAREGYLFAGGKYSTVKVRK